jgi:hypothetical protein
LDGKQEELIGQLFARRLEVDKLAQLDSLTDRVAIARPQLDGLHAGPPLEAKDTMLRLLSTCPQRRGVFQVLTELPSVGVRLANFTCCIAFHGKQWGSQGEQHGYFALGALWCLG